MCGIAGILASRTGAPLPTGAEIGAMVRALHHRGPDDSGMHLDGQVGLGHARLSIIDLASGHQPVHNEDRTVWVVFNGEIFNYVELRTELRARGHRFYTQSDTEVIVHAYEEYGLDFVHQLNGQFAIALWDSRRRRLLLCRDRVGIRPLFYTEAGGRLAFASEVKALLCLPGTERRLDLKGLAEVFTFWAPLPPRTMFQGISALPPGHLMTIEADGTRALSKYWDFSFPAQPISDHRSEGDLREELRSLLIDSVRLQLRADVPVGAYLSGGLDSSIITTLIKHYTQAPLRTFSLTFESEELDESRFQRELVAFLGTRHTEVHCRRADIAQAFRQAIWHAETAIVRTAPTPLLLLSAQVRREGYKVVLTGEGADEVFGGYDLFKEAMVRRFWARQPGSTMRPKILSRLYPYLQSSPMASPAYAQSFFRQGFDQLDSPYFGHLPRFTTTQRALRFLSEQSAAAIAGWDPLADLRRSLPAELPGWPPLCRDQYIESRTLLSGYLLCSQGDRMAMANSVEGRFPFLDHRVIEFAARLPTYYKLLGLREKYLLKRTTADLLPPSITSRPKQPYRSPDSQSFFVEGRPVSYVADLMSPDHLRRRGYFDPDATGKLFEKCRTGRAIGFADNMAFVGILSTMLLDEMFIRSPAAPQ